MSMVQEAKLSLVQKLAAIRRNIPNIEKKGRNEHFKYDFMRAEDVAGEIGDELARHNIVLGRENGHVEIHKLEKSLLAVVTCDWVFVDGDSGERLVAWGLGSGEDRSDKACLKANTASLKYALTQTLCMRVGHADPETDDASDGKPPQQPADGLVNGDTPATREEYQNCGRKACKVMGSAQEGATWMSGRSSAFGVKSMGELKLRHLNQLHTELDEFEASKLRIPASTPIGDDDIPF